MTTRQKLYKLTTQDFKTRSGHSNETVWGPGVTHTASGLGNLCGPGFLHAYLSPELAVLLNPIHAKLDDPVLWECSGIVAKSDFGLKVGCSRLRTLRVLPSPVCTTESRARFAILCALSVYNESSFKTWAQGWISGTDRSESAAKAARAAWAEWAAAESAAWAAKAARAAAESAARAAAARAAWAAKAARAAAESAEWAATAAWAAAESAEATTSPDLVDIALKALYPESGVLDESHGVS